MTRAEERAFEVYPVLFSERTGKESPFPDRREAFQKGYEQAEKDLIDRIRKQVETWMPEKDGEEYTDGKRLAFRSVLQLLKGLEDEK